MKLVELLAKVVSKWPEGAEYAVQDGDRRQTIKYGKTKGNLGIKSEGHSLDVWQNRSWGFTSNHDFGHDELASDFLKAIVTKEQWQAERDRQKGGEWKRHRGGVSKLNSGQVVEVKLRCGDIQQGISGEFIWMHDACDVAANIMQYRVISQPQAEEVEVIEPISTYKEFEVTGQWHQIDGPLAWRDRIIHCQAIIEDCEREIQRNVDQLDAEGLMMQVDSKKAMQAYDVRHVEPKDWQIGDILEITKRSDSNSHDFKLGEHVKVDFFDSDDEDLPVRCYALDDSDYWYIKYDEAKFIRRP